MDCSVGGPRDRSWIVGMLYFVCFSAVTDFSTHSFFFTFKNSFSFFSLVKVVFNRRTEGESSDGERRNEMVNWNFLGIIDRGKRGNILK